MIIKKLRVYLCLTLIILAFASIFTGCDSKTEEPSATTQETSGESKTEEPAVTIKETINESDTIFSIDDVKLTFEKSSGKLIAAANSNMELEMDGLMIDVGFDGSYKLNLMNYTSFGGLATWEIPNIAPKTIEPNKWEFEGFIKEKDGIATEIKIDNLRIKTKYKIIDSDVKVSTTVTNLKDETAHINGIGFVMRGVKTEEDTNFSFPGNVPYNKFELKNMSTIPVQTGLVNSIIRTQTGVNNYNIVFVDKDEKWSTAVYKDKNGNINYINLAAVESKLDSKKSLDCGDLYIQLTGKNDPYKTLREFYSKNGWEPPKDGVTDGPMYSTHPLGSLDSQSQMLRSMEDFSKELKPLQEIGIKNVWMLPIFEHGQNSVYDTSDMRYIDVRYGSDDGVRKFTQTAHDLDMRILFDYVPKGPEPYSDFGKENKKWASVDLKGNPQLEWECYSFDMANPEYQEYIKDVVKDHVKRFDVDGARIDCAMGGLPNWKPYEGNRPSNSSLLGGYNISRVIREGFVESGKKPLILPENFNPVPLYYPYTDLFYDMPLYRVLYELNHSKMSDKQYAEELQRWLSEQRLASPEGLNKLRFLGNHDTVSWVWDKARATKIYGEEKAKAMWALMSFIDGIPLIYQGDENPEVVRMKGSDLREFFKDLFAAREKYLGSKYDIEYITTNSPIIAFRRFDKDASKLVLINLSKDEQKFQLENDKLKVVYGKSSIKGKNVIVEGYGYTILQ